MRLVSAPGPPTCGPAFPAAMALEMGTPWVTRNRPKNNGGQWDRLGGLSSLLSLVKGGANAAIAVVVLVAVIVVVVVVVIVVV